MKKIILLLISLLLVSCSTNIDFRSELEKNINAEVFNIAFSPSNTKDYYSYYLSPSLGVFYSDMTTNVFNFQNTKIIMNLNVSEIINHAYYNQDVPRINNKYLEYSIAGKAINYNNEEVEYVYNIYKYEDIHILELSSEIVQFMAQGDDFSLLQVSRYMMQILKSINIKEDKILLDYSSKETIEYTKETIELFEQVVPVDGKINDILDGNDVIDNTSGDNYSPESDDTQVDVDDEYQSDDYEQY